MTTGVSRDMLTMRCNYSLLTRNNDTIPALTCQYLRHPRGKARDTALNIPLHALARAKLIAQCREHTAHQRRSFRLAAPGEPRGERVNVKIQPAGMLTRQRCAEGGER